MTQETVGYVELEWTCKRCGTKNPGSQKTCSGCGGAMSDQDQFELPAQQVLITDENALKEAELGPDIHCPYCGTRNKASSKTCSQCGGDLTGAAARQSGQVMGAFQAEPVPDVPCPYCGTLNLANTKKCTKCGGSLAKQATAPAPAAPTGARLKPGLVAVGVAAVALLCICGIVFSVLSARTTDTAGVVQAVSWERTIQIMEQRPVTHEDWQDSIPSGVQRGTCMSKVRSTQDQPAPGAEKVCGAPYTIDEGSGKGKVVQDCKYEVYDDWCKYTVNEWTEVDKATATGNDLRPQWPDARLKSGQREGNRDERYGVVFTANDKRLEYSPKDATEFSRFNVGSQWTLKVNTFGTVTGVQPAK
jgi:membrane protease subunit (stomatin/prohibitin family)